MLPEVEDYYGDLEYTIELRGDKGTRLVEMIKLDLVKGIYYLNFDPKIQFEGKTYYFSIWIMTKGAKDGKKYPMSLKVDSLFDPSAVPFKFDGSSNEFEMDFQFAVGPNRV